MDYQSDVSELTDNDLDSNSRNELTEVKKHEALQAKDDTLFQVSKNKHSFWRLFENGSKGRDHPNSKENAENQKAFGS